MQMGSERGDCPGHPRKGEHPKSEITKIRMLQPDDFSYCKITNAHCMRMGVGRNFLQGGANGGISRGSQKDFARGEKK